MKLEFGILKIGDKMKVLHVGCGKKGNKLPEIYKDYKEVRLDIDEKVKPDYCCSIVNGLTVPPNQFDSIFSCHCLEHLHPLEVPLALHEMYRLLNNTGFVFLIVPDLEKVAELILQGKLNDTAYLSEVGPITPLDIIYGYKRFTITNKYMCHKCGFTQYSLTSVLQEVGFYQIIGRRIGFDVQVIGTKTNQIDLTKILEKI